MTNSNGHGQIEGRRLCLTNLILCNGNIMEAKKIKYTYHGYNKSFLVIYLARSNHLEQTPPPLPLKVLMSMFHFHIHGSGVCQPNVYIQNITKKGAPICDKSFIVEDMN